MITKEIALKLQHGTTLYHRSQNNSDGTPMRCRVNGKCKTWKTRLDDFQLPVKHGLRDCFYITPRNAEDWNTTEHRTKEDVLSAIGRILEEGGGIDEILAL